MTIDYHTLVQRPLAAARLIHQTRIQLTEEQQDALTGAYIDDTNPKPPNPNNDNEGTHITHSDPTGNLAGLLAPYAHRWRRIQQALTAVDEALDRLEAACNSATNNRAPADLGPRCPGWNDELRAQLGGCGKILETYKDTKGNTHTRSTWLCVGCRKAKERAEREQEQEAAA